MAEELISGIDMGGIVGSTLDGLYIGMFIIVIPLFILGVAWLLWFIMQFRHSMVLEQVTGGKNVMRVKKFREAKKKTGTAWQLMGSWERFPPAPAECIKTTHKGNMFVELAYSAEGNYQWKHKKITPDNIKYVDNDTDQMIIKPSETFTTIDKTWYIDELRLAEERRKKESWLAQHGATLAIGFMFLMALGIVIFGAEEVFQPALEAQQNYLEAQERTGNIEVRLAQIEHGVQEIAEEVSPNE